MSKKLTGFETRLDGRLVHLETKMDERLDKVFNHIDGLYKRDETREQEYLAFKKQFTDLEKKCA